MADATKRTALIAHPGAELYGSDRVMLETLAGLVERGWRVVLAVPADGPLLDTARDLGAEIVLLDVPVLRKSVLKPANLPRFLTGSLAASRRIDLLLRDVRPDVVYVSTLTVPLWVVRARARRIPVLCHVHESERQAPLLLREAIAWPLRLADRVVANSLFSLDSLTEVMPSLLGRSTVVYNGVPGPGEIRPARRELTGGLRVVYVGRLSPRKGVDVAVAAIALLADSGFDAHLDLVGGVFSGYEWYEQELRSQVAWLGIEDRVTFSGFQPSVWHALADADVAVVPSRLEEPFGNTAVEAVLAARPVVVSAIGGLAEAIDGFASAVPVDPDDPVRLAEALHRIATDWPAFRRTAAAAAPDAARRYAPESYRRAMTAELERIAGVAADTGVLVP
jgi:glycosyltransferase involved in cell wall biosynthesis